MNSHEKLSRAEFESFFDGDNRLINERKFRQKIFKGGIHENVRQEAWLFLFQFYPFNSTPRERNTLRMEREVDYKIMREKCKQIMSLSTTQAHTPMLSFETKIETYFKDDSIDVNYMKIQSILKVSRSCIKIDEFLNDVRQIDKDIPRTGYLIEVDQKATSNLSNLSQQLRDILVVFSAFNQKTFDNYPLGYTQGMNELASVFLSVLDDESLAYWCFSNYMLSNLYLTSAITLNTNELNESYSLKTNTAFYFTQAGLLYKTKQLVSLLKLLDIELFNRLKQLNVENLPFCHEWLLVNFKRLFSSTHGVYLNCFEMLASHFLELETASLCLSKKKKIDADALFTFDLFLCMALLKQMRHSIMNTSECTEFEIYDIVLMRNKTLFMDNFYYTFQMAQDLYQHYLRIEHFVELTFVE